MRRVIGQIEHTTNLNVVVRGSPIATHQINPLKNRASPELVLNDRDRVAGEKAEGKRQVQPQYMRCLVIPSSSVLSIRGATTADR